MTAKRQIKQAGWWKAARFGLLAGAWLGWATLASAVQPQSNQAESKQGEVASTAVAEPGPESVHILVGHSLLIRTAARVRRIVNGNPAVLEWVMTSPRELVISAKQPGGSSLMLWDEAGRTACWTCSPTSM